MKKRPPAPRVVKTSLLILAAACIIADQSLAAEYYHLGRAAGFRIDNAEQYSDSDGSTTPATVNPGDSDDVFFYNSTVTDSPSLILYTGPYPLFFNSMTFRNNTGDTHIERSSKPEFRERETATVVSLGKGGITVDSGAGAITFGGESQRVVIGVVEDLTITNNSDNDLTFNRVFDGRSNDTIHNVLVTGSGSGNTVFVEGIRANSKGRDLAMTINTSGSGVVRFEGNNTYTGPTTVTAGKLLISGDSSNATGPVTVSTQATLGGSGTLGGDVTIADNGRLEFALSTPPESHQSLSLAESRNLTLTFAGASELAITSQGGAAVGKYKLITVPDGILGTPPATLNLPEGWQATVSIIGNDLVLDLTSLGSP
jgi:autotransporter-associated beta strand protein